MARTTRHAFTLVEILIVVVILGILAALVSPSLAKATDDAAENTAYSELKKVRRAIDVYMIKHQVPPDITEGADETNWGPIVSQDYLSRAPRNPWVGTENGKRIVFGAGPDAAFTNTHAWIYNPATGEIWAGGFDAKDQPFPK